MAGYRRLEVDFGIWGTLRKVVLGIVVLMFLMAMVFWYIPILKQTKALEKELEIKRLALKKQQEIHQKLSEDITALKTDPEAVERAIREKIGLAKPNETIYHFEPSKPNN